MQGKSPSFKVQEDGTLTFQNRQCVPNEEELKWKILQGGHNACNSVLPATTKMCRDIRKCFWWSMWKCRTCQKVKAEHQRPIHRLKPLKISTWRWDSVSIDFVIGLLLCHKKRVTFKAMLVGSPNLLFPTNP